MPFSQGQTPSPLKAFLSLAFAFFLLSSCDSGSLHAANLIHHDLTGCLNTDYLHNPYEGEPLAGSSHYEGLRAGEISWQRISFKIAPAHSESGQFSIFTTGGMESEACQLSLVEKKTRFLALAIDGANIVRNMDVRLAKVVVSYADGATSEHYLMGNQDVWSYHPRSLESARFPHDRVIWKNARGAKILATKVLIPSKKIPTQVEIFGLPTVGVKGRQPRVAVFALTQVLKS